MRMKPLLVVSLIGVSVLPFFAQAQADTASVQQTLMQMERDWGEAAVKNHTAAVAKFLADDWLGIDFEGKSITKAKAMADLNELGYHWAMTSEATETEYYEIGPMKVRVFGNTAVVTGIDTEKSTYKGKNSSGKYVWTDVWVVRDGRWQAVASRSVKVGE
jgi:ketosteroid isomerase-like protein